ncbi:reverse transcriptase domain-containing protein [Tanacetum coccineum]
MLGDNASQKASGKLEIGKYLIPCNLLEWMFCEEYAPELLGFSNFLGGNPTPTSEPFTSEFILEEIKAYLKDDSISLEIDYANYDPEEDICLIENLLNDDPLDLKQSKVTEAKSSIEEPPELELKDLSSHLEYAYLEENDKLPVIIAKRKMVGEILLLVYDKLDDALWEFHIAFKTPIGCMPYKLVYEKSCHLPIELEHKAYWALKHANFDLKTAGDHRKLQLNELHDQAYENSLIYKERTKKLHDSKIKNRIFNVGDRVLLFNSRLKIFSRKLKTRWSGPFTITKVFPCGTIELSQPNGPNFKVNGHRVKHYFGGDLPPKVVQDLHTFSKDE